jgi:DNA-binding NarL/FixJ family response regulator
MQDDRPISVLILYAHPLLGEGLADLLSTEPGLEVVAVRIDDSGSAERALETVPQVIIFERGEPDRAVEMLGFAPDALIIDIGIGSGRTFTYRRDEISALPDAIVAAIRTVPARRMTGRAAVAAGPRSSDPTSIRTPSPAGR